MKLQDRVSIVTGGGSGLGRSMCVNLAKEGSKIVVADMNMDGANETVEMIKAGGGEAIAVEVNVTDAEQIESLVKTTVDTFGSIDVLCNNAGIGGAAVKLLDVPDESWDKVMAVDLKSVFLMSKRVLPQMLKQGKGVIINTASASGLIASNAGIEYTAAKHGIVGFTKQLAFEYGHEGIRVLAIAPGVIETPLTAEAGMTAPGGIFHELTMNAPAGRYGKPDDIGKVVAFLASDDASFMHGNTIPVEGGSTIL
ncbi:SDR family NAD(P)-dependent oxidoreductase [Planococcus beigongshangi]|uniref:SDR family NAD(P)-dependent oxidoreductase n=1 Tax=Planococcus beigongshangi TaxID=2782536 RepID=UPI00193C64C5|nr:glucose 1-dehydrogenase [Planococcus beigongshangi]